jgi:predicted nucleotidyltransferase
VGSRMGDPRVPHTIRGVPAMAVGKHGNDKYRELAERGTILRVRTGSGVHGISTGSSDRDEVGVCIEPPEYVIGLKTFEQYMYRDAAERTGKFDARSGAGDLDLTIYSLRKFMRLALNGNPSIIETLFTQGDDVLYANLYGRQLQEMYPAIVSMEAAPRYIGYLLAQKRSLESHEGKGRDVTRPELIEKYGFDVKYAGHMIRLGIQGVELMEHGRISLPMRPGGATLVRDIRTGKYTMVQTIQMANEYLAALRYLEKHPTLPEHPDRDGVNVWLIDAYRQTWEEEAVSW